MHDAELQVIASKRFGENLYPNGPEHILELQVVYDEPMGLYSLRVYRHNYGDYFYPWHAYTARDEALHRFERIHL